MKFSKLSKILIVVLLVSVLAISLIACSTSKNNKDEKQSIDSSSSTLMATEPNSADEASKLYNQLMEKENEILSTDKALWEKVFMASNKDTPMIEDGTNYGDFLLKTIEGAKDQFTDEEYKKLVAGAEQIKEIEGKLTILEQKYPECANAPSNGDSVPADSNGVISKGGGATSFPSFDGKDLDGNDIKSSDFFKSNNAVQLLERIKHYLYDDRITFVFSVNLGELQHTIKHYYGNTFDACRYLDRFFDMRISLPPADKTAFYREMGLESSYVLEKICRKVIDTYNMELREATRFYRQVKTAAYEPTHESRKFDFSFSDEKGRQLLLMYVVPILVGLKIVDISLYNQFVCGKSSKPLMDIYKDSDKGEWLATRLLNRNEAFEVEEGKSVVTVEQKIQQLYDAIFVTEYTGNVYHTILGEYEFDDNSKNFVKSVESMLSVYADYNI